jgi:hypothetical protein
VWLTLDPQQCAWVAEDEWGAEVRRWPAEELRAERILSLTVTNRR